MEFHQTTIAAPGREISLIGTAPEYLAGLAGQGESAWAMISHAIKDVPHGSLVFDVGANIGFTALMIAVLRPDVRIRCFEPVPTNGHCLRENVFKNGFSDRIIVTQAAVGDKHGEIALTDNGPYSSSSAEANVMCPVVTLDEYIDEPAAFLKIDTEGYEPHVFAGARHFLQRHRPLILSEFNGFWYIEHGYNPIAFAEALYGFNDVLGVYHMEQFHSAPSTGSTLAWVNLTQHGSVTDLLLRPRSEVPPLAAMTQRVI